MLFQEQASSGEFTALDTLVKKFEESPTDEIKSKIMDELDSILSAKDKAQIVERPINLNDGSIFAQIKEAVDSASAYEKTLDTPSHTVKVDFDLKTGEIDFQSGVSNHHNL